MPDRPIGLLKKIISGDKVAWKKFINAYSGVIWSIAWRYSKGDKELSSELFLAALEGLCRPDAQGKPYYRLRRYIDSLHKFGKRSRFTTWLALVTKNVFRDWFRQTQGRRWIPKEISGLDEKATTLYKALVFDALTQSQAQDKMESIWPHMGPNEFQSLIQQVHDVLKKKNLWTLYRELLQRIPPSPMDHTGAGDGGYYAPDTNSLNRPDLALETKQRLELAKKIHHFLEKCIKSLPRQNRIVLELTTLQGFTGEQVKIIMGFRSRQKVYDLLANTRRRLRIQLEKMGVDAHAIEEVTGYMDSGLADFFSPQDARSNSDFRQNNYGATKIRGGKP